jgi:hypothetical protein
MLDAAVAQGKIHAVLLRLTGQVGFGDVVDATAFTQSIVGASQNNLASTTKISPDGLRSGRLHHLAVPRVGPFAIGFGVAFCAGCCAGIGGSGGCGH